jgi:sulfotransferase
MMKKIFFLGGLPRAGSTLLCNILAQNPEIHATHTSGCLEVLFLIRNQWDTFVEHKAHPLENTKREVLKGILHNYYWDIEKPIVIDKSRGWVAHIEMLEWILGEKVKVLVPVRDLRDVLASFEKLWRQSARSTQINLEKANYMRMQRLEDRLELWCNREEPVGVAVNRVKDGIARGFRDRMHFVEYETLCREPRQTMEDIYKFLELTSFEHDFNHVEQITEENDDVHGFGVPLHKIRSKVEPQMPQYPKILGAVADRYAREAFFWRTL